MSSRYDGKRVAINDTDMYRNVFKKRGINYIRQYTTAKFKYPTAEEMSDIDEIGVVWGIGDRFWKFSAKYYNNPEYWWVISFWNQKTEMDIENGMTIYIPLPLEKVLSLIEVQ